jgi:hypothetical protein
VRDLTNPLKCGSMLWQFPHLVDVDSINITDFLCMNMVSKLYGSFFFFVIFRVFLPDFSSTSLDEFFFISFRGFVC